MIFLIICLFQMMDSPRHGKLVKKRLCSLTHTFTHPMMEESQNLCCYKSPVANSGLWQLLRKNSKVFMDSFAPLKFIAIKYIYMYVYMFYACVCICIRAQVYTCKYIHICVCIYTHACVCIYVYTYVDIQYGKLF